MTSRLRRKHRITVLNIRRKANDPEPRRRGVCRRGSLAAFVSAILGVSLLSSAFAESEPPTQLDVPADARPIADAVPTATSRESNAPGRSRTTTARWGTTGSRRLGSQATAQPTGLGWRQPDSQTTRSSRPTSAKMHVQARDAEKRPRVRLGSYVRPAAQFTTVDPFDDPFGDRFGTEMAPSPTVVEMQEPENAAPALAPNLVPANSSPGGIVGEVLQSPRNSIDYTDTYVQQDSLAPYSANPYDARECGKEQEECDEARNYVRTNPITNISLDITPDFTLGRMDDRTGSEYEQKRDSELSRIDSRVYRDRQGEVVAEGYLQNFQYGRVVIRGTDGEITKLPFAELSDDDMCFVTAWWSIPTECALGDDEYQQRQWLASTLPWKASGACHKPLYFQEAQLERYGHSAGPILQPVLSGASFFVNLVALPYNMGIHPPHECQYPLGYYRPGNCAPWLMPPIPLSVRAGLLAAGVYVGGVYLIP